VHLSSLVALPQLSSSGVRCTQGSVLGPLLFLIYINDVMDLNLSEGSSLVLYADDILLYRPVTSEAYFVGLQSEVNMQHSWLDISHKRSLVFPTMPITLNGTVLEMVHSNIWDYLYLLIFHGLHIFGIFVAKPERFLVSCTVNTINTLIKSCCFNCTHHWCNLMLSMLPLSGIPTCNGTYNC